MAPPAAPRVSVIVPAYNAERTLAATLKSVAEQTLRDFEVIVIDDGSSDGTVAIAEGFRDRLPKLSVISRPNGGVARARNTGIEASVGGILAFLDADDVWHPTWLEKGAAAMEAMGPDCTLAYSYSRHIDMNGRVTGNGQTYAIAGWAHHQMLLVNFVNNGSAALCRRDAALEVGGFNHVLGQGDDYGFQLDMTRLGTVALVPEFLVGYRDSPGSLTKGKVNMTTSERAILERAARLAPDLDRTILRWAKARAAFHVSLALRSERQDSGQSWRLLITALMLDPIGCAVRMLRSALLQSGMLESGVRTRALPVPAMSFDEADPVADVEEAPRVFLRYRWRKAERADAKRAASPAGGAP